VHLSAFFSWLSGIAISLWLWPLNLLRDFPVRVRRVKHTWVTAVALPHHLVHTIHLLCVQLFDLAGAPELIQVLLRLPTHTTALTPEERDTIIDHIGVQMRLSDVRLAEGGILKWVFRFNGNLAFTAWHTIFLPQAPASHSRQNLALLVHELTHVYQYEQVGTRYMTEAVYMLITTRRNCYDYGGSAGLQQAHQQQIPLSQFNREQQAQIVQDYFSRCQAGKDTSPYLPYLDDLRHGRL